ncbi:MAG: YdiU family protein [Gemmatimonadales bacterium]|nr:YdiU family protein [Gemmatimonadales bacterium]
MPFRFDTSYLWLPDTLFARAAPARVREPRVVLLNHALAAELGVDLAPLSGEAAAALFAGQAIPPGAEPIAQAYAGHQFGGFTILGDGRAILLGEHVTPGGARVDIQFKGSGQTPYSRRGDGRAALGPMLREYILGEAMHALGIPTTRALAVVTTGEPVLRDRVLRGAILTRVAASHLRVGTFQYLQATRAPDTLRTLADYAIGRHDPALAGAPDRYLAFFRAVLARQAALIARWQGVGFVHGVMNTDNMAISGETIDYGPCAFLDAYSGDAVFSSIDAGGRYAFGNQPVIAQWNLARLAEALLPLFSADEQEAVALATAALDDFPAQFERAWLGVMRAKLGLRTDAADDGDLVVALHDWMEAGGRDFTNTFRALSRDDALPDEWLADAAFADWHARWLARLGREGTAPAAARAAMRAVNPAVIARNHRVEEALAAAEADDLAPLEGLVAALRRPFDEDGYYALPGSGGRYVTYCGT